MTDSRTRRRLLSSIFLFSLTVACTQQPEEKPGEVSRPAENAPGVATARAESPPVEAPPAETPAEDNPAEDNGSSVENPATEPVGLAARTRLSPRFDLELPEGPPSGDPVEPGSYILSILIMLDNGQPMRQRRECTVDVQGETMTIQLKHSATDPIIGTFKDGYLVVKAAEAAKGAYGLEGQVVGPGRLRGEIIPGEDHKVVSIVEGRWGLDPVESPE